MFNTLFNFMLFFNTQSDKMWRYFLMNCDPVNISFVQIKPNVKTTDTVFVPQSWTWSTPDGLRRLVPSSTSSSLVQCTVLPLFLSLPPLGSEEVCWSRAHSITHSWVMVLLLQFSKYSLDGRTRLWRVTRGGGCDL